MSRAIVLGGGGVTGIAWEAGVLTGLAEAGADLTADAVIGTSVRGVRRRGAGRRPPAAAVRRPARGLRG